MRYLLEISLLGKEYHYRIIGNFILVVSIGKLGFIKDIGFTGLTVLVNNLLELINDNPLDSRLTAEDILEVLYELFKLFIPF